MKEEERQRSESQVKGRREEEERNARVISRQRSKRIDSWSTAIERRLKLWG